MVTIQAWWESKPWAEIRQGIVLPCAGRREALLYAKQQGLVDAEDEDTLWEILAGADEASPLDRLTAP